MFNYYMYFAVGDRKIANPFVGHVLSKEWNSYYFEKESGSAVQPKEKDAEKVRIVAEEVHSSSPLWKKSLKSPKKMLKPSKMRQTFKWKFSMQLLKKN